MRSTILLALATAASASASPPRLYERQSAYPAPGTVGPTPKAEWVATYNAKKAQGKIPGFAPSVMAGGNPSYGAGVDTGPEGVCSWTLAHCFGDNDISEAPDGKWAVSFDDGPLPTSVALYNFLQQQNQTASHFFIGTNILNNLDVFKQAVAMGGHIGSHTWSHPYLTTLTDMQLLGELGWTSQIIHDYSGLVPAFFRPPYGDADSRVRAIAEEVFGLTLAGWDVDSFDWCLSETGGSSCVGQGPTNDADLRSEIVGWQTGGKSPGIMGLEHELTTRSVGAFITTYPGIKQHGWDAHCIPDLFGMPWYINADGPNDTPDSSITIGTGDYDSSNSTSPSSASSAAASTSSSASSSVTSSPSSVASVSTSSSLASAAVTTGLNAAASSRSNTATAAAQSAASSTKTSAASTSYTAGGVVVAAAAAMGTVVSLLA